ncbi:hypothetical protein ACTWQB_17130, partial [Piscibacillus sp. B03]|uniref:hypothetical protein n=1 Tax=Piscibacillus sp. B03 TaxID=3457430 RepID=UPI003FCDF402
MVKIIYNLYLSNNRKIMISLWGLALFSFLLIYKLRDFPARFEIIGINFFENAFLFIGMVSTIVAIIASVNF